MKLKPSLGSNFQRVWIKRKMVWKIKKVCLHSPLVVMALILLVKLVNYFQTKKESRRKHFLVVVYLVVIQRKRNQVSTFLSLVDLFLEENQAKGFLLYHKVVFLDYKAQMEIVCLLKSPTYLPRMIRKRTKKTLMKKMVMKKGRMRHLVMYLILRLLNSRIHLDRRSRQIQISNTLINTSTSSK